MLLEALRLALSAIGTNPLRSILTVLGNIVAVTSIIAVVSLIQGIDEAVSSAIVNQVGADSFVVERYGIVRGEEDMERVRGNPLIRLDDADAIRTYAPSVSAVMAQARRRGTVSYREHLLESVLVQGVSEEYVEFSLFDAARGRLMTPGEVARHRFVAVLGWGTADRLFGELNPIEKTVKIEGVHFRVVGVSSKKGSIFGQSQDEFALIPLGAFRRLFGARPSLDLMARPADPAEIAAAMDEATVALRIGRGLKPAQDNDFGMFTSGTVLGIYEQATRGIFAVLIGVVALSLVVGGIVIMNIMLMVVTERTREIGLRKALGARRRDIAWQMLIESVLLSVAGGATGTLAGFGVARALSAFTPLTAAVQPWSVALGVSLTAAVGLTFGLYPALRAASLDPIEALRRE